MLKPPGGGSSDIFGSPPEEITSPRRMKVHNQSQLGSALFGDVNGVDGVLNANASPRCANKPGNDSYKRLFGPPDAPSIIPNARNHMRSNISLSGGISSSISSPSSAIATSPARSIASSRSSIVNGFAAVSNGSLYNDVTGKGPRVSRFRMVKCLIVPEVVRVYCIIYIRFFLKIDRR